MYVLKEWKSGEIFVVSDLDRNISEVLYFKWVYGERINEGMYEKVEIAYATKSSKLTA